MLAGTEVICPRCSAVMMECIQDVKIGEAPEEYLPKFRPVLFSGRYGEPAVCPKCSCEFFDQYRGCWTKDGWTW